MKHVHYTEIPEDKVENGAEGVTIRWLIAEGDGAPNFAMRHFEIAPGGHTPEHQHAWEHEVFILAGEGMVLSADGEEEFGPGDVVFMPGGEKHRFRAGEGGPVRMLCLVPLER